MLHKSEIKMKRNSLRRDFRQILAETPSLRKLIANDVFAHEQTILRWAVNDSPKLCTDYFLNSLRKHGNIAKGVKLIEQVEITLPHEVTA